MKNKIIMMFLIYSISVTSLIANSAKELRSIKISIVKDFARKMILKSINKNSNKFLPGSKVYDIRRKTKNGWSGFSRTAVFYKGKTAVFDSIYSANEYLFLLYKKPITNKKLVYSFFSSINHNYKYNFKNIPIKVNKINDHKYHIYVGSKFFKYKSGYLLTLNSNQTINKFTYKLELSK